MDDEPGEVKTILFHKNDLHMTLPLISIITPIWNAGSTVEKNLLSVINQQYKAIEHIFVDGCSEDDTISIIRDYQKKHDHIRLITEKDSGIYDAINKGMAICTGGWIYIMGADDEFYNEKVLIELVEQGLFNEEQVVYGNVLIRGDSPWAKDNSIYDGPFTLEKLFRKNICHQAIFYPRSVLEKVGYYSDKYHTTSDWDYNVHCFARYKFAYTDKIISIFKSGGKSSNGGDYALYEDFPENIIRYFQLDPDDNSLHDILSPFYYPIWLHNISRYRKFFRELEDEMQRLNIQLTDHGAIGADHKTPGTVWSLYIQKNDELIRVIETGIRDAVHLKGIIADHAENLRQTFSKHKVETDALQAMIHAKQSEIDTLTHSLAWKTGKTLLAPVAYIIKIFSATKTSHSSR